MEINFSNEEGLLGGWRSCQHLVLLTREMEELKYKYLSGKCSTLCCLHKNRDPVPRELTTLSSLFTAQLTLLDKRLKLIKKKLSRLETRMYGNLWYWSGTLIYDKDLDLVHFITQKKSILLNFPNSLNTKIAIESISPVSGITLHHILKNLMSNGSRKCGHFKYMHILVGEYEKSQESLFRSGKIVWCINDDVLREKCMGWLGAEPSGCRCVKSRMERRRQPKCNNPCSRRGQGAVWWMWLNKSCKTDSKSAHQKHQEAECMRIWVEVYNKLLGCKLAYWMALKVT